MKDVDIYVFSGTGNTLHAAVNIKEAFISKNIDCKVFQINSETDPKSIDTTHTIGIGFPIAVFCTYTVVLDFIKNLPHTDTKTEIFIFSTMGGSDGYVCAQIAPLLVEKGYKIIGYEGFIMPSNYMLRKIDTVANDKLLEICKKRSGEYVDKLCDNTIGFKVKGKLLSLVPSLVYRIFYASGLMPKKFKVKIRDEKCNGCGVCVNACPVNNISLAEGKAIMGDNCQVCMRCVGFCPENAIHLKNTLPYSSYSYSEFYSKFDDKK